MFSLTTKLHMLLIGTVSCVAIYMFFLYKEIKVFEKDIATLKAQVASIAPVDWDKIMANMDASLNGQQSAETIEPTKQPVKATKIVDNADDDNESVTSKEIKDILTNIHEVDNDEEDATVPDVVAVVKETIEAVSPVKTIADDTPTITPTQTTPPTIDASTLPDFTNMNLEELNAIKFDTLREILKSINKSSRGTKSEMAKRIWDALHEA